LIRVTKDNIVIKTPWLQTLTTVFSTLSVIMDDGNCVSVELVLCLTASLSDV